ncbi:MAG: hypothetical protein KAX38_08715, partial [Candidatus Krumholzibacteria bacterium]|nr:hypothetical protein [Candidatus Krumholzibacteria bacterium]
MSATGDLVACDNFRHSYWSPGWVMTLVFRFTVYYQYEILIGFLSFLCCAIVFSTGGGEASGGDRLKKITKGDTLRLFLAGVLLGAAALISPRVLVLILLFGIALYMQGKTIRFIKAFPVFLTGILLVLAPWTARNYRCFGELILTTSNGEINLYIGNNPSSTGGYCTLNEEFHPDLLPYQSGEWM